MRLSEALVRGEEGSQLQLRDMISQLYGEEEQMCHGSYKAIEHEKQLGHLTTSEPCPCI